MDFMNLNQAAHGDREFGFMAARMRLERKVVVGHWTDPEVGDRIGAWARAACAKRDWETGRIARFGDNMRDVAVTDGDKVEAQRRLGFSVDTYRRRRPGRRSSMGASDAEVDELVATCTWMSTTSHPSSGRGGRSRGRRCATERGSSSACGASSTAGPYMAFTTTFEDLHGLTQLPGLAVQRLMRDGYGFGAEGDWKTAAMVRAMKVMTSGLPGGVSFMEDYTYHLDRERRPEPRGAHAGGLRVDRRPRGRRSRSIPCRSAARRTRSGSSSTPIRARAVIASIIDMGQRFRMVATGGGRRGPAATRCRRLPVARALWRPRPDLKTNAAAWIHAGGSHHTSLGFAVTPEHLADFAAMSGTEFLLIDETTQLDRFRDQLRWNDLYYLLARGL